jgi:hypothetical protein
MEAGRKPGVLNALPGTGLSNHDENLAYCVMGGRRG